MASTSHVVGTSNSESHRPSSKAVIGFGAIALGIAGLAFWIWQTAGPARAALEQQRQSEIAAESRLFCEKWGQPAGTQSYAACVADLNTIREQHEKRIIGDAEIL